MNLRPLLMLCSVGVGLRLLFLLLAGNPEFQSDEANYVYLALSWNHFGFYSDSYRYLWAPGYPFLLGVGLQWFGMGGLLAVKLLQVAASASVGLSTMLVARRLFDDRAAKIAGLLWIGYLPLVGFTHYFWSETLFLALLMPGFYLLLSVLQDDRTAPAGRLIAAGLLFAGAGYFKEVALYLAPVLAVVLFAFTARRSRAEALRQASLFLLVLAAAVFPWTLRNYEVYGRIVPMATSLGENVHVGVNAFYRNYDLWAFHRSPKTDLKPDEVGRRGFVEIDAERWTRAAETLNTPDRLGENARRGMAFAAENPAWLARSRIKKLADFTAPISFFLRHLGLGLYDGTLLGAAGLRQLLAVWALLCPLAIQLLALPGLFLALRDRSGRWLTGCVLAYFLATSMLVSMSRFRIPIVPLLIVLAAGALSHRPSLRGDLSARRLAPTALAIVALLFLWWVDLPEIVAILTLAWRSSSG